MTTLVFKSEEEREQALNAIPEDAPPGMDIDDFKNETTAKIDEIMSAEIDENAKEEPGEPAAQEPAAQEPANQDVSQRSVEPNPEADAQNESELFRKNNEYLKEQQREMLANQNRLENEIKELRTKNQQEKPAEKSAEQKTNYDEEIANVQEEIEALEQEMNKEDVDVYEENYIKNLKKQNQLSLKLTTLNSKRHQDLIQQQQGEIASLKNDQALRQKQQREESVNKKTAQMVENFQSKYEELKTHKTYNEMDTEYTDFAVSVAAQWFGKSPGEVTAPDTEIAMKKYLEGSPALIERLNTKGIGEPQDMKKFIVLSEVNALSKGYVMDKTSGKWTQLKDAFGNKVTFPNIDAAYAYYKQENGVNQQEVLQKQNESVQSFQSAVNERANPSDIQQEHRNAEVGEMTQDRADQIFKTYSETEVVLRGRKDFNDPVVQEYNKALKYMGYPVMEPGDL